MKTNYDKLCKQFADEIKRADKELDKHTKKARKMVYSRENRWRGAVRSHFQTRCDAMQCP